MIISLVIFGSFAAYQTAGHMGIEERFRTAVGISHTNGEENVNTWFGVSLEGNPLFYGIALGALAVLCYAAYRYFSV